MSRPRPTSVFQYNNSQSSYSANAASENELFGFRVASSPAAVGDFNSDGRIDASDYVAWRHNNGSAVDYNLWREHFGQSVTGSGASLESASGPVASSLALLIFAAFTLLPAPRRKSVAHNCV